MVVVVVVMRKLKKHLEVNLFFVLFRNLVLSAAALYCCRNVLLVKTYL